MLTNAERNKTVTAQEIEHFLAKKYSELVEKMDERISSYDCSLESDIERLKGGVIALEDLYHELFLEGENNE